MYRLLVFVPLALALTAVSAFAQANISGYTIFAGSQERIGDNHWVLRGGVELEGEDTKLYAEQVEVFTDQDRAVANGNVVFSQGGNWIAADRADFNTRTRLGTFFNAYGTANIKPQPRSSSGFVAPQISGQETDVYFFGDEIEKIGAKKYRISNGGFTTCVQPTARWDLSADTIVLNIDHYTMLRQAILRVKGVPLLYLPILYYPTKEEDRATGFLLPTYGSSTLRGQAIHNAFFWAIDRSQDATFLHDWYSRTGQGFGSEYRYNLGTGYGNLRGYVLDQHEYLAPGNTSPTPATRSYDIRGDASQLLPWNLRGRARVNYFSSIETQQSFNTDVYSASNTQRSVGGNVVGAWRGYSLNGTFERSENFYTRTSSGLTGSSPRISVSRGERALFPGADLYVSASGEFAHLDHERRSGTTVVDQGLTRFDVTPQIRYPFKRWQWFTVNSSISWRDTFYSRSLAPGTTGTITDENVNRRYFTLQANAVGPVLNRVWDTPDSGYAERFKHSIEPFVNVQRTSSIDSFDRIVRIDSIDAIVGGTTSYRYGVNNRFYAKRRVGQVSRPQEIVNVELTQTYYTNAEAARYDTRNSTSFSESQANNFSPISLSVRTTPSTDLNATLRAEIDSRYLELMTLSALGSYNWGNRLQTSAGWSHRYFIENIKGFNDPARLDHYLNASANAHTLDNRFGGVYSFNYDLLRSAMLQQRISAFYNAQCCGIAFEYQRYNFRGLSGFGIPADQRFFLSFTLAGLGNFSPFNGAMSGVPR